MVIYAEDEFQKYLAEIDEELYDISGGDIYDLEFALRKAYYAGWDRSYETLSTKDI